MNSAVVNVLSVEWSVKYTPYIISNPERLSKTELVGFALFPYVNMVQDVFLHLPCDCQVICTLCGIYMFSHTM